MNGKQAKRIRKECYNNLSLRDRKWYRNNETGQIIRDENRHRYQKAKERFLAGDYDRDEKGKEKAREMINRGIKNCKAWEKRKETKDTAS